MRDPIQATVEALQGFAGLSDVQLGRAVRAAAHAGWLIQVRGPWGVHPASMTFANPRFAGERVAVDLVDDPTLAAIEAAFDRPGDQFQRERLGSLRADQQRAGR